MTLDSSITESKEVIPPRDDRDAAIKSLEAKCRAIVNLAHDVADAERDMFLAESGDKRTYGIKCARFGALEERLYNSKDDIERDIRQYNIECGFDIYVSHSSAGLPIRVSRSIKTKLWS